MPRPKAVILRKSVHHGSTAKIARAIAAALEADVVVLEEFPSTSLDGIGLLGPARAQPPARAARALECLARIVQNGTSSLPACE